MARRIGIVRNTTTLDESVSAFVPNPLPPSGPAIEAHAYATANHAAKLALARLPVSPGWSPPRSGCFITPYVKKHYLLHRYSRLHKPARLDGNGYVRSNFAAVSFV